mmetsp:Transcript_4137/g.7488  ORF Transcript_4137/g.7488 Transcript_4137/m.7488 type:complete len:186 (-) Transcript_4137:290-847(-)
MAADTLPLEPPDSAISVSLLCWQQASLAISVLLIGLLFLTGATTDVTSLGRLAMAVVRTVALSNLLPLPGTRLASVRRSRARVVEHGLIGTWDSCAGAARAELLGPELPLLGPTEPRMLGVEKAATDDAERPEVDKAADDMSPPPNREPVEVLRFRPTIVVAVVACRRTDIVLLGVSKAVPLSQG